MNFNRKVSKNWTKANPSSCQALVDEQIDIKILLSPHRQSLLKFLNCNVNEY